jgi:hypothetical protein
MASIDRSDPIILGHVLAEHHDLFCRLSAARTAFSEVRPSVDTLARLHEHFAKEEHGGFLEESVARMPRLGKGAAAIMKQHPALLAELDNVLAGLPSSVDEAEAWLQASRDFEAFTTHMLAHERSENAILQEGYNEDLGLA